MKIIPIKTITILYRRILYHNIIRQIIILYTRLNLKISRVERQ